MSELQPLVQAVGQAGAPLIEALRSSQPLPALGLRRSARLPVLAAVYRALNRPVLLVTDRADHALTLLDELGQWLPEAPRLLFPEPTPLFYEEAAWGESTRRDRLLALTLLSTYHIIGARPPERPPVLVAPARALMTRTMPRREYLKAARTVKLGQSLPIDDLARLCVALGYQPSNIVIASGQFARRGGLLDIWPPAEAQPTRLEFFGDEIDTLRRFDPATQRTIKLSDEAGAGRLLITPAAEFLMRPDAPQLPGGQSYAEFHIPLLHAAPASLLDYLPREAITLLDDRQAVEDAIGEVEAQALTTRADSIKEGTLPAEFPIPYLSLDELRDSLSGHYNLDLGLSLTEPDLPEAPPEAGEVEPPPAETQAPPPAGGGIEPPPAETQAPPPALVERHPLAEQFAPGPRFAGRLRTVMEYIAERAAAGDAVTVITRQVGRLRELWDETRPKAGLPGPDFIEGSLAEGWSFTPTGGPALHLLTDGEIFGWRRPEPRRRPRPSAEAPESGYSDLHPGDHVVHVDHGIGRFSGLVQRTIEGVEREYLAVEYADDAQLFVPIHQADRLTRYVGPDSRDPKLSRLGSSDWKSVKNTVREAVQEVAEDLLELYAKRSVVEGHAYPADNAWQQELEASFPYIETDDQMRVIGEVKRDMQAKRPMDRLICGDVGYGKTEVALRAAFKAVNDGKQVAVLVPTTVLAQQHYTTFSQRLAPFPVTVEMLSRFRNPQQQKDIINRLGKGKIDILVGTHRLLSNDVDFKDLGLLIIDEEQRFGVTHKEALKQLRTEVDVLTLTATPIPRTLYMALSGVRDISTINTPPEERLPIITHVGPYSPKLVKQAIQRELERGGQIFFVHNRVQTIGAMHTHLAQLVPEARIAVGHGQMNEGELARVMEAFSEGEVDILLCTSIIESGLDIPNANTLIVDRADTFGLAQLYQLRGRVGRGAQRAYAYFFRHKQKTPTPDGRLRLETIAENTQLGAGFNIAMRDLEIRGAGDILGARQHGHIADVGFHLYTAMLADAVRKLRDGKNAPHMPLPLTLNLQLNPINVELPIPTAIPAGYVPDKTVRLGLYRRMADMRALRELDALVEEFQDRFGPPPEAVQNLFYQLKVKLLAERAGLASIVIEGGQLVMRFQDGGVPADLPELGPGMRAGKFALWMDYETGEGWREDLLALLKRMQPVEAQ
ncbi:MAG: transcription-repair coupling factor [Chloroflexota bacterium]